ncbi:hypothetical protein VUR80DRAFT_7890 [Thermomyces stellatus]
MGLRWEFLDSLEQGDWLKPDSLDSPKQDLLDSFKQDLVDKPKTSPRSTPAPAAVKAAVEEVTDKIIRPPEAPDAELSRQ